jgi:enoyl-CoA hydratase
MENDTFEFELPEFELLDYRVADGVAIVTLRRPEALNALNQELFTELGEVAELARIDDGVRVLILTGEGRAFAAGADIPEITQLPDVFAGRNFSAAGQAVMNELAALPKPTIAAINGFALGGGLELALACNLRVAHPKARLGLPEVGLGLIPGYGGTQRLPRLIGRSRALDLILTGRHVTAEEALQLGLINRIADDALQGAIELAQTILRNSPLALGLALEAVERGEGLDMAEALETESDLFGLACTTQDMREGTRAFLEKRTPEFRGE